MEIFAGVTTIASSVAAVTVNVVGLLVTPPDVAWIVVDPMASD